MSSNNSQSPEIKNKMITSNCNAILNACDYSNDFNCLAFISANLIHIYDTKTIKTYLTLKGHSQRANSVRWINSQVKKFEFLKKN